MTETKREALGIDQNPEKTADHAGLLETLSQSLRTAAEWQATLIDAIESISEAFGLFDADDRLILCNQRYAQTFTQYDSFEEISGWHFTDLVRASVAKGEVIEPEFANDIEAWVAERTRRHRSPGGSLRQIQLGDGSWLQVSERPTQQGGIVGVRTDISALKAAQHAAEAANESKTRFLRNMSHEIRTPMNGVLGMAQLLAATPLDLTQRRYVEAIEQSGAHLLSIINDILDFSKVESGRFELESIAFDIAVSIEESAAMLAQPAHAKGLELIVDIAAGQDFMVIGDPLRLQQIVINLVNNAIKFTERGQVVVSLTQNPSGPTLLAFDISVADSGVGIAAESHERIFDHFAQADGSTARRFGGTGLGLAICRQLSRKMGGDITLQSTAGSGSVFKLSLTLPRAQSAAPPQQAIPAGKRALLLEDHPQMRALVARELSGLGLAVTECGAAGEALALLERAAYERRPFDLALLDMTMHRLDPLATARAIRQRASLSDLPLLMLSSSQTVSEEDRQSLRLDGIIAKPLRRLDMASQIAMLLQPQAKKMPSSAPVAPRALLSGKVLLAEDNDVNKMIVIAWLERMGFTASHARNGKEAVQMAERDPYDLILMDCQMPEMDGFVATREIRRREAETGGHVPIIALTANAIDGDRDHCLEAGMDDYLTKPFRGAQLSELLTKWLPATAQREREPAGPDPSFLDGLVALDPERGEQLRREIVALTLTKLPSVIAALQAALAADDADRVTAQLAALRLIASGVGAVSLMDRVKDLAEQGPSGDRRRRDEALGALVLAQQALCHQLREQQIRSTQ